MGMTTNVFNHRAGEVGLGVPQRIAKQHSLSNEPWVSVSNAVSEDKVDAPEEQ